MDIKKLFEKYRSRLVQEALLKALLCEVIVGFAVTFIIAFVTSFLTEYFDWWFLVALGVGLVVGNIVAIILYFAVFRPDDKTVAKRVDSLGLKDRLITMIELKDDDSYIAKRQREDAKIQLSKVDVKSVKFAVAKSLIIAAIVVGVLGVSMTTVNALVQNNVLPVPGQSTVDPYADKVIVLYEVDDPLGGYIEGESEQIIDIGGTTSEVVAVAYEGWAFRYWEEDKSTAAQRSDKNVIDDDEDGIIVYTAHFEMISEDEPGDDMSTDESSDVPQDETNDEYNPEGDPNEGQGDRFKDYNQIKDGDTPYQDEFDIYYEKYLEAVVNGNYTAEQIEAMKAYMDILKGGIANKSNGNN